MKTSFIVVIITLGVLFGVTGCSQSPESHCKDVVDHFEKITGRYPLFIKTYIISANPNDYRKPVKKDASIESCLKKYNKDIMNSLLEAEDYQMDHYEQKIRHDW